MAEGAQEVAYGGTASLRPAPLHGRYNSISMFFSGLEERKESEEKRSRVPVPGPAPRGEPWGGVAWRGVRSPFSNLMHMKTSMRFCADATPLP